MKFAYIVISIAIVLAVKGQPPKSDAVTPLNVQITLTSETLGEGTIYEVLKLDNMVVVTISASEPVDTKKILPAILTEIVVQEVSDGLNSSVYQDSYVSFYRKIGNAMTYDDLFGYHSDKESFQERVLRKYDAAAGPSTNEDPLTKDYSTIRQLLRRVLSADELVGPFNGQFLHSLHEKSRQIVAQVLGSKPEAVPLSDALISAENAVERAQYCILKLLDILRKLSIVEKPSHHTRENNRKSLNFGNSNY